MFNYATFSLIMILIKNRIPYFNNINSIKIPYNLGKEEKVFPSFQEEASLCKFKFALGT